MNKTDLDSSCKAVAKQHSQVYTGLSADHHLHLGVMPLTTVYDVGAKLIHLYGEGVVSMEDRRQWVGQVFKNPEYSSEADILVDVCQITNAPDGAEYLVVAELIKLLRSRFCGRIAIVNTQAGHVTTSNLIALTAELSQNFVRVFYKEAAARAWLAK